jgi:hypothetical protein
MKLAIDKDGIRLGEPTSKNQDCGWFTIRKPGDHPKKLFHHTITAQVSQSLLKIAPVETPSRLDFLISAHGVRKGYFSNPGYREFRSMSVIAMLQQLPD